MYGIFTYIYHKNQPNVGKYTSHGSYGLYLKMAWMSYQGLCGRCAIVQATSKGETRPILGGRRVETTTLRRQKLDVLWPDLVCMLFLVDFVSKQHSWAENMVFFHLRWIVGMVLVDTILVQKNGWTFRRMWHILGNHTTFWPLSLQVMTAFFFNHQSFTQLHPGKLTRPLKRHYIKRKYIFQPLIFRGHVSFRVII